MRLNRVLVLIFAISWLVGCSTARKHHKITYEKEIPEEHKVQIYQSTHGNIPLEINPYVNKWIQYYQGRGRKHMRVYLERSTRYEALMKEVIRSEGLPEELFYMVFVESGFSSSAHSHAGAVGYWQFIRSTGRRYGMTINAFVDERKDPLLSSESAAQYWKDLYNMFGDWKLALASYNTGENRVKRSVKKYKTNDYWVLMKSSRALPRETRDYVPKFMAAMAIAKNPAQYGFDDIDYKEPIAFETMKTTKSISLRKLAQEIGIEYDSLKEINPRYRSDYVPIYRNNEALIRVPVGTLQKAVAAIDASYMQAPVTMVTGGFIYRVRRGDTLSTIARRYNSTVMKIRDENDLGRRSLLRVGQRLRIPDRTLRVSESGEESAVREPKVALIKTASASENTQGSSVNVASDDGVHIVRRGENLSVIANKYRISLPELKRLNGLKSRSVIRPGQKLIYKVTSNSSRSNSSGIKKNQSKRKTVHTVRRGETLIRIAKKYKVPMSMLARANALNNKSRILIGSRLVIPSHRN